MNAHQCSVPDCGFVGTSDRMWNLDRKQTGGKLVVVCGKDAHEARKQGIKAYRLSETIRRDAERESRRLATSQFFQAFKKAEAEKKTGKNRE